MHIIRDGIVISAIFALKLRKPLVSWGKLFSPAPNPILRCKRSSLYKNDASNPGVLIKAQFAALISIRRIRKSSKLCAWFVTRNHVYETGSMTGILRQLKCEPLKKRRKDNRNILLYKGLKGKARIPKDDLIPKTRCCSVKAILGLSDTLC